MRPTPILHLHCPRVTTSRGLGWKREEQDVDLPLARVLFDYAGAEIGWQDGRGEINHVKDNRLLVLPRDALFEVQMIERLNALGLQPLGPTGLGRFAPENCRQDFTFEEDEDDDVSMRWVEFNHQDLPQAGPGRLAHHLRRGLPLSGRASGRRLEASTSTSRASTGSTSTWASRSTASGCRCCRSCSTCSSARRRDLSPAALDEFGEDHVFGTLPDGRLLPIPASRLKAMLEALYELFASRRIGDDGKLRLSRAEMTRADRDRDAPCPTARCSGPAARCCARWRAGWRPPARSRPWQPPKGLKATLRHYQEDGFAWLQFLSSLGLSGVLADDMGLGKTVQALAHILAEKQRGQPDQALPDRLPDQPGPDLAQRGAQVRARPRRAGPARQPARASCSTRSTTTTSC